MRSRLMSLVLSGLVLSASMLAVPVFAQNGVDADKANREIGRRGGWVELTGITQSNLMTSAMAPPADDSDKWYLTLVYKPGNEDSQNMRQILAHDPAVRPWVDVNDASKSPTHFQLRSVDDQTQKDWMRFIAPAIREKGVPILVLQPPRNGKFGNPSAVVKMIHGYCKGEYIAQTLQAGVREYIASLEKTSQGVQATTPEPTGVAPPFTVPAEPRQQAAVVPPGGDKLPFEYPPSKPIELTLEQVRAALPADVDPQFVLDTMAAKPANVEIVKLQWMVYEAKHSLKCDIPRPVPCDEPADVEPAKAHHDFFRDVPLSRVIAGTAALAFFLGWYWSKPKNQERFIETVEGFADQMRDTRPQIIRRPISTAMTGDVGNNNGSTQNTTAVNTNTTNGNVIASNGSVIA